MPRGYSLCIVYTYKNSIVNVYNDKLERYPILTLIFYEIIQFTTDKFKRHFLKFFIKTNRKPRLLNEAKVGVVQNLRMICQTGPTLSRKVKKLAMFWMIVPYRNSSNKHTYLHFQYHYVRIIVNDLSV